MTAWQLITGLDFNQLMSQPCSAMSTSPNNNDQTFDDLNNKALKYETLMELNKKLEEEKRVLEVKLAEKCTSHDKLVSCLEERVNCPVCLDVPTSGNIYSCPEGHLICASCYQGSNSLCPLCRTRMGKNVSLLASTVIENIEHACKFEAEGCKVKSLVGKVEKHRKGCAYRPVVCPSVKCKKKVSLAHLIDHILNVCDHSRAKENGGCKNVKGSTFSQSYNFIAENLSTFTSDVDTFSWEDDFFFLTKQKGAEGQYRNFYVQMLGPKEDCKAYRVKIHLEDESGQTSINFCDNPYPIDMDEEAKCVSGLPVSDEMMRKICSPHAEPDRLSYTVSLEFSKVD